MAILTTKHCREAPAPEDGTRILVMRYWPRGMRKERFDAWYILGNAPMTISVRTK